MNYLLLGGAGFVGTHLAKKLQSLGHSVTIIDNLSTGVRPNWSIQFIEADIVSFQDLEKFIKQADIVYFLAGSLGVDYIDRFPKQSLENNLALMNRLIPLFEKYKSKVVFSSTSEVYGEGPFSEDNNLSIGPPTKLRWGYAAAKLITEFSITSSSFPYVIVRFFNVVGPGQLPDYGMVLPKFIRSVKNNEDLIVYGTGEQIRSFCHINDAVDALLKIEKFDNEIFNLGNDTPISINMLAKKVIDISRTPSKIVHVPYQSVFSNHHSDILNRVPKLDKLKYLIGFFPKHNIDDIINDML